MNRLQSSNVDFNVNVRRYTWAAGAASCKETKRMLAMAMGHQKEFLLTNCLRTW
jgi:hypothetical protein